jgi:hypothetical protein
MEASMGGGVAMLGIVLLVVGGLMLLWAAFSESIVWGLACLVIPFVSILFVVTHWQAAKRGFLVHILGWVVFLLGGALTPTTPSEDLSSEVPAEESVLGTLPTPWA